MKTILLISLFIASFLQKPIQYSEEVMIKNCSEEGQIKIELDDRILIVPVKFKCII